MIAGLKLLTSWGAFAAAPIVAAVLFGAVARGRAAFARETNQSITTFVLRVAIRPDTPVLLRDLRTANMTRIPGFGRVLWIAFLIYQALVRLDLDTAGPALAHRHLAPQVVRI